MKVEGYMKRVIDVPENCDRKTLGALLNEEECDSNLDKVGLLACLKKDELFYLFPSKMFTRLLKKSKRLRLKKKPKTLEWWREQKN